jgi:hypothetical protein
MEGKDHGNGLLSLEIMGRAPSPENLRKGLGR